ILEALGEDPGTTCTPAQALEFALSVWAETYPWLDWNPLPDLLLRTSDGPVELEVAALSLLQVEGRSRSMRQLIDEMLSLFTGYVLRADADNKLTLVAPPWAAGGSPTVL